MPENIRKDKGERSMSLGFIAQYAAEASLNVEGVASLEKSTIATIKESFGVWHEGQGVEVSFLPNNSELVDINIYPNIFFGFNVPEVAWQIQSSVKADVEKYTGLDVNSVNVYVRDIILSEKFKDVSQLEKEFENE